MTTEKQKFDEYVKFTAETSQDIIKDTFEKGMEKKYSPTEILSVFQSCLIVATRYVIESLITAKQFDVADSVIQTSLEILPTSKIEFEAMRDLIEKARNKK